jgi:hypothetical protein
MAGSDQQFSTLANSIPDTCVLDSNGRQRALLRHALWVQKVCRLVFWMMAYGHIGHGEQQVSNLEFVWFVVVEREGGDVGGLA